MKWFVLTWSLYGVAAAVVVVARKICRTKMDFVTAGKGKDTKCIGL